MIKEYKSYDEIQKDFSLALSIMLLSGCLLWITNNYNLDKNLSIIIKYLGIFFGICTFILLIRISAKGFISPTNIRSLDKGITPKYNHLIALLSIALVSFRFKKLYEDLPVLMIIPFGLMGFVLYNLYKRN